MGTETASAAHVACSFAQAAGKQASRRRGGRARRTKERRGASNQAKNCPAPAADIISRCQSTEAAPATKISPPPYETAAAPIEESTKPCETDTPKVEETAVQMPEVAEATATSCPDLTQSMVELREVPKAPRLRRGRTWPLSVNFDEEVSVHSITPYAEVYGMHPRLFDFDKGFSMVPAIGFGAARQALIAAAAEMAARRARGEDAISLEDEEEDEVLSEDESSDEELCTEYHLAPPRDAAEAEPRVAIC